MGVIAGLLPSERGRIERMFGHLKQFRRIATRYDKTALSFAGFLNLTAIRKWVSNFVNAAQDSTIIMEGLHHSIVEERHGKQAVYPIPLRGTRKAGSITLDQIIAEYGLPALFVGAAVEGETVVVIGGIMVHRGILPFLPAIAAASAGSFVADQIFFLLGRRFRDHAFVQRVQRKVAFAKALSTFERHPTIFVFAFRFLYGLRTVSPIAIGTTQLPVRTFLLINAVAATVWGAAFVSAGYFFGSAIEVVFGRIRSVAHIMLPLVMVAIAIGFTGLLIRRRKSADRDATGA